MVFHTEFGTVRISGAAVLLSAMGSQLRAWASRPGAMWPCSELAEASMVTAEFDHTGLVDLDGDECLDLSSDEFNAWSSDVLREVLPPDHPAYHANVGQFLD